MLDLTDTVVKLVELKKTLEKHKFSMPIHLLDCCIQSLLEEANEKNNSLSASSTMDQNSEQKTVSNIDC